jgi:hypothetical protein
MVVTGNILPAGNVVYNLGSPSARWKELYLSGATIDLNGARITSTNSSIVIANPIGGSFEISGSETGKASAAFGNVVVNSGVTSTSVYTGALTVDGGVGVLGNVNASSVYSNNIKFSNGSPYISALGPSGVTAGNYGSATSIPTVVVDTYGRVTSITSNAVSTTISLAGTSGTGSVAGGGTLTFAGSYGVTASASGSTVTLSTPQDIGTLATPTFAGGTFTGDVNVNGVLTVANLQARGSMNIVAQDPMLYLQANVLYPWNYDTGIFSDSIGGPSNVYVHHGIVRSTTNNYWGFFSNVKSEPDSVVNWNDAGLIWDQVKAGSLVLANTTTSTSTTTGALIVDGGAGIAGSIYSGGLGSFANGVKTAQLTSTQTTASLYADGTQTAINLGSNGTTTTANGSVVVGGLQATAIGNVTPGAGTFTTLTVNSTSTHTGAASFTTATTGGLQATAIGNVTPGTGAFTTLTTSGVYTSSGNIVAQSGTASASTTTGALVVNGGAGFSGNVRVGGLIQVGTGTYTKASITSDIYLDNGATDTPGVIFCYGNNTNWGIDVSSNKLRFVSNLNESGGAERGWFDTSGSFYATGDVYSSYSDIRLKTIVGYIEDPIALLKQLEVFYYEPNEEALRLGATPGRKVGVSAQSALKVQPETVGASGLGKDYLTVQYERLVPLLVETCKKQQDQIEELQRQVEALQINAGKK